MNKLDEAVTALRKANPDELQEVITLLSKSWHLDSSLRNANLRGMNLEGVDMAVFDFTGADLTDADFSGALLHEASLDEANLLHTNFTDTRLDYAKLLNAKHLTIKQLRLASNLEGCLLPDGTRLPGRIEMGDPDPDWQSAFEEWCNTVSVDEKGFITGSPDPE